MKTRLYQLKTLIGKFWQNTATTCPITSALEAEARDLMKLYFDGLYHSKNDVLRTVFHSDLAYVNGTAGIFEHMVIEDYMAHTEPLLLELIFLRPTQWHQFVQFHLMPSSESFLAIIAINSRDAAG